jgi:hypothetical protein
MRRGRTPPNLDPSLCCGNEWRSSEHYITGEMTVVFELPASANQWRSVPTTSLPTDFGEWLLSAASVSDFSSFSSRFKGSIRHWEQAPGLAARCSVANVDPHRLQSRPELGFDKVGPCSGRVGVRIVGSLLDSRKGTEMRLAEHSR